MNMDAPAYGLWSLVIAFSFTKGETPRDWRSFGAFSAFIVALFAEMYGFYVFIGGGFVLLSSAWNVLYQAQRRHSLATTGPYAKIRHPQYDAFVLIMFGFLLQWPTILTLLMFPVLVWMYVRLARSEERDTEAGFGKQWREYAAHTPRFMPLRLYHGQ